MAEEKQAPAVPYFLTESPVAALHDVFLHCPGSLRFCRTGIFEELFLKSQETPSYFP